MMVTSANDPLTEAAREYLTAVEGGHPDPDAALARLVCEAMKIAPAVGVSATARRTGETGRVI